MRKSETGIVWSYSFLNDYDPERAGCPHKAYHRYVLKDLPFESTPELERGRRVHKSMENRLNGAKLPEDLLVYEGFVSPLYDRGFQAEAKLGMTETYHATGFFADDVWGRCVVDTSKVQGNTAYLLDWKTGKEREDPFELEIQGMFLKVHYPKLKRITGRYAWLKTNKLGQTHDLSDTAGTYAKVSNLMDKVKRNFETDWWPKVQGPLCGWCQVKSCEFNKS
jgi:hypothetical protein